MDNSNSYRLAVELRDRLLADLRQNGPLSPINTRKR